MKQMERCGFEGLPEGILLGPGQILVRFRDPDEGLKKLMALAIAIGKDQHRYEQMVRL
jgi:hypothetical protein